MFLLSRLFLIIVISSSSAFAKQKKIYNMPKNSSIEDHVKDDAYFDYLLKRYDVYNTYNNKLPKDEDLILESSFTHNVTTDKTRSKTNRRINYVSDDLIDAVSKEDILSVKSKDQLINSYKKNSNPLSPSAVYNKKKKKMLDKDIKKAKKKIPFIDEAVKQKRQKQVYRSLFASLIAYGSGTMNGFEKKQGSGEELKNSFSSTFHYNPFVEVGLAIGMSYPIGFSVRYLTGYRIEAEFAYNRLQMTIDTTSTDQTKPSSTGTSVAGGVGFPDSDFALPTNYGSSNMFSVMFNGVLDLMSFKTGEVYLGAGVGVGIMQFDSYTNLGFILPLTQVMAGYRFNFNKLSIAIGYKLSILYPTQYTNNVTIHDVNNIALDGRPLEQNLTSVSVAFIHKVQLTVSF